MSVPISQLIERRLRSLTGTAPDGELLRRYIRDRDADAFADLVARHSSVVLGVCRRTLGVSGDVEDAFQATFLTLARRARSVRNPERLAGWLHRVAVRTARRARARRRPMLPLEAAGNVAATSERRDIAWREGLAILDEELNALPERLRTPLVLCYLEGLTRDEAAERIGCSAAKLKRILEAGRRRLRNRLMGRGVSAAILAAVATGSDGLRACVPQTLLERTIALAREPASASVRSLVVWPIGTLTKRGALAIGFVAAGLIAGLGGAPPAIPQPAKSANKAPDAIDEINQKHEAPLPEGAIARIGSTRFRHPNGINNSAISPNGKLFATTAHANIAIWDLETGERKQMLTDVPIGNGLGARNHMAFSPDGKRLANICESMAQARIWDVTTGKQLVSIGTLAPAKGGSGNPFTFATFSADGKELRLFGDHEYQIHDATTGRIIRHKAQFCRMLAASTDGNWFLSEPHDRGGNGVRRLAVVDVVKDVEIVRIELKEAVSSLSMAAISADGKRAAIIADSKRIHIWDATTGKRLATFDQPAATKAELGYSVLAFSPDGKTLLLGTTAGKIQRYDIDNKKELPALGTHSNWVTGVHVTADGKRLISTGWDSTIRRFDLAESKEIPLPPGYATPLYIAAPPKGDHFAVGSPDRLDLIDAHGKHIRNLLREDMKLQRLAFSPDGKVLAVATQRGAMRFWNTIDWKEETRLDFATPVSDMFIRTLQFSSDGKQVLISFESKLACWEVATRKQRWQHATKDDDMAVYSPDGKLILSGGWNSQITWRDAASGDVIRSVKVTKDDDSVDAPGAGAGTYVDSIAFAPDGRTFITAHHDGLMRCWDTDVGTLIRKLKGHGNTIWWAKFSSDGKWVASGSVDHSVRIWEYATGQEVRKFVGHHGWVWHGVWSADGRRLLTSSGVEALLWNARSQVGKGPTNASGLWDDLAGDPATAYRAQWALLDDPKAAVKILRERQQPEQAVMEEKQIAKLIDELDSDKFRARESSMKKLRELGRPMIAFLRDRLKTAGAEGVQRIRALIADLDRGPTANELRCSRAVQVLELARTSEAAELLKDWSKGHATAWLTQQSIDALNRVERRHDR